MVTLEDALLEWVEWGLGSFSRSCLQFDCVDWVTMTHGEECTRGQVVQYELDVFGLPLVIVSIFNRHRNTESSIGPILYERVSGVCVAWKTID